MVILAFAESKTVSTTTLGLVFPTVWDQTSHRFGLLYYGLDWSTRMEFQSCTTIDFVRFRHGTLLWWFVSHFTSRFSTFVCPFLLIIWDPHCLLSVFLALGFFLRLSDLVFDLDFLLSIQNEDECWCDIKPASRMQTGLPDERWGILGSSDGTSHSQRQSRHPSIFSHHDRGALSPTEHCRVSIGLRSSRSWFLVSLDDQMWCFVGSSFPFRFFAYDGHRFQIKCLRFWPELRTSSLYQERCLAKLELM